MSTIAQSESELENNLIQHLSSNGYEQVEIRDQEGLKDNLRRQIELHNKDVLNAPLSDTEFKKIIHHLDRGSIFDRAKTLRSKMSLELDNGDLVYIIFLEQKEWCRNIFQVTNQITMHGKRENRYDVTLLINGLPLVQIELKKRGVELKDAFNQTGRYKLHSYGADKGLFN